jgi:ribosomal protein L11 methyltransferase
MAYLALSFDLGAMDAEQVEAECFASGALAVTLSDSRDDAVLEPAPGERRLWPATRVQAIFDAATASAPLLQQLAGALQLPVSAVNAESLADRAWEREWLRDFHAMRFGRRLWVSPHHETVSAPEAVVVKLDPGLAFGTGTHPSTALCLEWLDANVVVGAEVIDYGCGSGILGIAAVRLGARRVQGFDIDPQATLATRDNAERNNIASRIVLRESATQLTGPVDLLMANILAGTLIELVAELATAVRPGGQILLAGILAEQAGAVTAAYAPWFDMRQAGQREDWVALAGTRGGDVNCLS